MLTHSTVLQSLRHLHSFSVSFRYYFFLGLLTVGPLQAVQDPVTVPPGRGTSVTSAS